jgi:nucleoside-diphosphate-sugar epimerase
LPTYYQGRKAVITGGLGFIGSNLAIRLVHEGARVTIIDSSVAGCGANPFNIDPVKDQVEVVPHPIGEAAKFEEVIGAADIIFNLAGEISHIHSMEFPERDMQLNAVSHLQFLKVVRKVSPGIRIVYASTRQVYGVPAYLPVDEKHPIAPVDFNGVHKYAATMYHMLLSRRGEIDGMALRLTNVYGPRMAIHVPCQGFLSTFLRKLLLDEPLEVFGDGSQLRDPLHVDDAVRAFLVAGAAPSAGSRIFNVGGPEALSLWQIAEIASSLTGVAISRRPFPPDRKSWDIGSYHTDARLIAAELGFNPAIKFREGLASTLEYYKESLSHYIDPDRPELHCTMPEHAGVHRRLQFA